MIDPTTNKPKNLNQKKENKLSSELVKVYLPKSLYNALQQIAAKEQHKKNPNLSKAIRDVVKAYIRDVGTNDTIQNPTPNI